MWLVALVRFGGSHLSLLHFILELFVESLLVLLSLDFLVVDLAVGVVRHFLLLDPRLESGHLVERGLVSKSLLLIEPLNGEDFFA